MFAGCLILLNFCFLFLIFFSKNSLRLSFVKTLITLFCFSFLLTEGLTFLKLIEFKTIFISWGVLFLVLLFLFFYKYKNLIIKIFFVSNKLIWDYFSENKNILVLFLFTFLFILFPLFFLAIYYPPNNCDSLGYHLPRIEHWIQNNSIAHFVTNDVRQIFYQPFAEMILLHLRILTRSDFFVALIQFFSMLGCVVFVSLIVQLFGLNYKYQFLSALLTLSIPMGILQSVTTQNDYLASFFLISFIYFCLRIIFKQNNLYSNIFWGGICLGLGFLTKSTVAVFAFPFCIWFALVFLKKYGKKAIVLGFIFLFFIIFINFSFWKRNYFLTGNILGEVAHVNMIKNNQMSLSLFISNLIRDLSSHFAFPFANRLSNKIITVFHEKVLRISDQEKVITFGGELYEPFFTIHEDYSGNFYTIFLILICLFYFLLNFKKFIYGKYGGIYFIFPYFLCLVSGYFLFVGMFKWQPWITRLDLPFFVLSVPFISYMFFSIDISENKKTKRIIVYILISLISYWVLSFAIKDKRIFLTLIFLGFVLYIIWLRKIQKNDCLWGILILSSFLFSFPYIYFNRNKPLLRNKKILLAPRLLKYFWAKDEEYERYEIMANKIKELGLKNVAIEIEKCTNEYLLWVILKDKIGKDIKIRHINPYYSYFNKLEIKDEFPYKVIISYRKKPLERYKNSEIDFFKKVGTKRDPLSIIIFKKFQK